MKKTLFFFFCVLMLSSPLAAQQNEEDDLPVTASVLQVDAGITPVAGKDDASSAEIPADKAAKPAEVASDEIKWSSAATPFKIKRKEPPAETSDSSEKEKQSQEREQPVVPQKPLPSPHQMQATFPVARQGASVSSSVLPVPSDDNFNRPQFSRRAVRGSAGGIVQPKPQAPAKRSVSAKKSPSPAVPTSDEEKNVPLEQKGLKIFDDNTAKEVMNFDPKSPELSKMSLKEKEDLLGRIVEQKIQEKGDKAAKEKAKKDKYRNINSLPNLNDNPYGVD